MIPIAAATGALISTSSPAQAGSDKWPCEVLLCISNPGGATQYRECLTPIRKLMSHLAALRPFPVCRAGGMVGADYTPPSRRNPSGRIEVRFSDGSQQGYLLRPIMPPGAEGRVGRFDTDTILSAHREAAR